MSVNLSVLLGADGVPTSAASPMPVRSRPGMGITQTVVPLTAGADATIAAANSNRLYLLIVNIGTGRATLAIGANAVDGQGYPLMPAAVGGDQGGGIGWTLGEGVPTGAVHAISAVGTTLVVLEG